MKFWQSLFYPSLFGVMITLTIFFPLLGHFSSVTTSPNDGPLIAWLIYQVGQSLVANENLYNLPFFYPYANTLTYSVPFLSTAILNLPLGALSDQLILNLNIHLLSGSVFTFLAMFILARELYGKKLAVYATAFLFAFSYLRLEFAVHLQSFLVAGIPLGIYFLMKYVNNNKYRYLIGFCLSYLYQALNDPMTAYFLVAIAATLIIGQGWWRQCMKNKIFVSHLLLLIFVSVIFYLPYVFTSHELNLVRTIRDTAHSAYGLERLFKFDLILLFFLLGILSFYATESYHRHRLVISHSSLIWMMVFGLIFMLGPVIKIGEETWKPLGFPIPLPYAIVYYILPGANAFRAVTRWSILFNFGAALILGSLVNNSRMKTAWMRCCLFGGAMMMLIYSSQQMPFFHIQTDVPDIYHHVREAEGAVLIELPIYLWDMTPYSNVADERLLYQVKHGKKLFNGVSGLVPPQRIIEIQALYKDFPNAHSIEILKNNQVELVLIHYGEYQQMFDDLWSYIDVRAHDPELIRLAVKNTPELQLVACYESDCLYRLSEY